MRDRLSEVSDKVKHNQSAPSSSRLKWLYEDREKNKIEPKTDNIDVNWRTSSAVRENFLAFEQAANSIGLIKFMAVKDYNLTFRFRSNLKHKWKSRVAFWVQLLGAWSKSLRRLTTLASFLERKKKETQEWRIRYKQQTWIVQ